MKRSLLLVALFAFVIPIALTASPNELDGKRPFTFEGMMALKRLTEPIPSPDGNWVLFAAQDVNLEENTKKAHLWIVPAKGGEARRLNDSPNEEERPRFSPDGKRIIFTSKATDPSQIWICGFDPAAGKLTGAPQQVTKLSSGADGAIWSPDGKNLLFVSSVYPDCRDDACNQQRDEALKKSKVKAKIFKNLLYRHWTAYSEFKRSHLFVASAEATTTPPRDLTPGDHDVPPFSLGGSDMYTISPDGVEIAYTSNIDEVGATSTNNEIFLVPLTGGEPKKISTSPGSDSTPRYSPDGQSIAWLSQARGGYESDRFTLAIYDRASGKIRIATEAFDRWVGSFTWAADSKSVYFSAEDHGEAPIYHLPLDVAEPIEVARLHADDLALGPEGKFVYFSRNSIQSPNEIWRIDVSQKSEPVPVTHVNDAALAQIAMQPLEPYQFKAADGTEVQGFLVKPPGFDASKKYPVKFLIHGGPEGAWGDDWSFRWNPELFAADGYVVVMINPRGSTGYGEKFTEGVIGQWGGTPFVDLMKGLDYAEKTFPFIDKNREAALGASYGGYMIDWILGHTARFKCLVTHDGVFNTESAYGTTEELWFPEWEFKGPPWKQRELYRKWSPALFAEKFKTPTLVVHGQLDFRLDVSQGFDLFTTLQRLGVPSEMLYFPDEGHWVLKPQNSRLWYKTVNDWVDRWTAAK
ncbi:MAG: S9 family peptidase [Chthoniobacterales bacterium]|nr:S9 family peptidase [Chthoniobacterales bacterium]